MYHRYTGELTFKWGKFYGPFQVEQCEPKPAKLGVGPYCVRYKDQVIYRDQFQGVCKTWIENLVNDHHEVARKIRKLRTEFVDEWQLPEFPESLNDSEQPGHGENVPENRRWDRFAA